MFARLFPALAAVLGLACFAAVRGGVPCGLGRLLGPVVVRGLLFVWVLLVCRVVRGLLFVTLCAVLKLHATLV